MDKIKKYLKNRLGVLADCEDALGRTYAKIAAVVNVVDESGTIFQWPEPYENVILASIVEDDSDLKPLADVRIYCEYSNWEIQIKTPTTTWGKPMTLLRRSCNTPYLTAMQQAILAAEKQIETGLLKSLERKANYPLEEK